MPVNRRSCVKQIRHWMDLRWICECVLDLKGICVDVLESPVCEVELE